MMGDRPTAKRRIYAGAVAAAIVIWPHVLTRLRFPIRYAGRPAQPNEKTAPPQQVFANLMDDATLTPLFNYHYRISAYRALTVFD